MAARHEQIGQRAGDEQAMEVLVQPAIAHLGKAEHPFDDPDRMLDAGPHFRLGAVFRLLDLIDNTAVAVAAVFENPPPAPRPPGHPPPAPVGPITPPPPPLPPPHPPHNPPT